jgi:hypothetical protein
MKEMRVPRKDGGAMFIESWMRLAPRQEACALGRSKSLSHFGRGGRRPQTEFLSAKTRILKTDPLALVLLSEAKDLLRSTPRCKREVLCGLLRRTQRMTGSLMVLAETKERGDSEKHAPSLATMLAT